MYLSIFRIWMNWPVHYCTEQLIQTGSCELTAMPP